ncbi:HEAT repeat domain-containing protein [Paenibacillaceae bacterium]|nr:HEAT repeat domain-containing protein [Paenibacillaceae bacterium]
MNTHNEDIEQVEQEAPESFDSLKKSINRTSNWRERLEAIEKLGQWEDTAQSINVLSHAMSSDLVYSVQQAAYQKLRQLGADVQQPARRKGELFKGVSKILLRIKKSLPADHSYEDFKQKLQKTRIDIYDTYEGDKADAFDTWLESTWSSLGQRRTNG